MNPVESCDRPAVLAQLANGSSSFQAGSSPWRHSALFLKCVTGLWKGGVINLKLEEEDVFLRLVSEGVDPRHCEFKLADVFGSVVVSNLSASAQTWIKLRTDIFKVGDSEDGVGFLERVGDCVRVRDSSVECFMRIIRETPVSPGDVIEIGKERFQVQRFNFASASVQGIRPTMEDEDYCTDSLDECAMFSVYDGHGGFECSRFLRANFHSLFASLHRKSRNVPLSLSSAFREVDSRFFQLFKEKGLSRNVGAVVCSVVIDNSAIYCANLGDCRAVLGLSDNRLVELSRDFKPGLKEESDRIHRLGGKVVGNRVNGRLAVSRAIGDFEYKTGIEKSAETIVSSEPEIRSRELDGSEQFLVVACDGLFDVMSSESVAKFVRGRLSQDPNKICVDLISESVLKRGTSDNVTVIVVLFR